MENSLQEHNDMDGGAKWYGEEVRMEAAFMSTMIWRTSGLRFQTEDELRFKRGKSELTSSIFFFHPSLVLPNRVTSLCHMTPALVPAICRGHRRIVQRENRSWHYQNFLFSSVISDAKWNDVIMPHDTGIGACDLLRAPWIAPLFTFSQIGVYTQYPAWLHALVKSVFFFSPEN